MSCGLPVIVSSRAGISDWLSDAHDSIILKDPENASELVSAIRSLAVDLPLRKVIATNAPLTARKFSWDTHVSELRKLLLKAAGQKSRGAKDY